MNKVIESLIKLHGESNLENVYMNAKRSYYQGEPILSDVDFDILEDYLKTTNRLKQCVGFNDDDRNAKFNHITSMLSLSKLQASTDGVDIVNDPLLIDATSWLQSKGQDEYEATPKFDGNAINLIYKKGKLDAGLSRGNGLAGRDYTDKLLAIVPNEIEMDAKYDIVEVRGEIMISKEIFDKKYSADKKNERNFVAGILNRPTDLEVLDIISDFTFMAVEGRGFDFAGIMEFVTIKQLENWGFYENYSLFTYNFKPRDFESAYRLMLEYRKTSPFRLDGFVIKTPEDARIYLGENKHDPNWAVAIKFPPEEATTTVIDIEWKFGKTGQLTPVAILEPTDLDGTTVQRASMHNYGYVISKGCVPGAIVTIAKKGDIIPQIINIKIPSEQKYEMPKHCPECNSKLVVEDDAKGIPTHLQCSNEDCGGLDYLKFFHGFNELGIVSTGGALIKKIYEAGFTSIFDVLDRTKFTKRNLTKTGVLQNGKTLDKMFKQITSLNSIELYKVIKMLGIDNMGNTIAKQVANKFAGIPYSFKSLEKTVCAGFDLGEDRFILLSSAIDVLKLNGIDIKFPTEVKVAVGSIKFEMTGSPKDFGYKTKEEFIAYAKTKGYVHSGIKDADVLFTDSLTGSSSKMKHANSPNTKTTAKLYSDI